MTSSPLGSFLRSRRSQVTPAQVGLPSTGLRRVPGLRREELAVAAGVSSDYYTKLEQGRERRPSAQLLDALARALLLEEDERRHLFGFADLVAPPLGGRSRPDVAPELLRLMDSWAATPAMVLSDTLDVLARNGLARELYGGFVHDDNLLRMTFLDPEGRRFYVDWQRAAEAAVANLRAAAGARPDDPDVATLVEELTAGSAEFASLWARQGVRGKTHEPKRFHHAEVGHLELTYQAFDVRSAPGQQLVVYQAEAGSPSSQALTLLGSLAATSPT
ncbi:helix-turn-helix transcriptional regulator [Nonomuraea sp. NPDC046802]|uniref:helix-turn-helix domain-containing protein n=1 Tax=Nonomuraea sp. NPDC046802 TaxID=3154919 RepID=UPI0033F99E32